MSDNDKKKKVLLNFRFTDFARNEIYAFHRTTIMLSTFILTASFALLSLGVKPDNECVQFINFLFFLGIILAEFSNILIAWIWLKRVMYKYYARKDKHEYDNLQKPEQRLCDKIGDNARKWELTIWSTFIGCIILFILFLLTSGVLSRFKDYIG